MRFVVELPAYLSVQVEAEDEESARTTATSAAGWVLGQFNDYPVERTIAGRRTRTTVLPLSSEEDAAPDVFLCREGMLLESTGNGYAPTGEQCAG